MRKVLDQIETGVDQDKVIREEKDGMRIFLDLRKLDKAASVRNLKSIISQIKT